MSDEEDKVDYHGLKIPRSYLNEINEAQEIPEVVIGSKTFERIRFGREAEDWGWSRGTCGSCGVALQCFHVPGCDIERCPACGEQAIGCDCEYESDEESPEM